MTLSAHALVTDLPRHPEVRIYDLCGTGLDLLWELHKDTNRFQSLFEAPVVALDTETTGLDPLNDDLVLITLAIPGYAYLFRPCHMPLLRPIFARPGTTFLIQHAPFDLGFIYAKFGINIPASRVYDTRLAERQYLDRTNQKGSASLSAQIRHYFGMPLDKTPQLSFKVDQPLTKAQIEYAAQDALDLFPLAMQHLITHRTLQPDNIMDLVHMYDYIDAKGTKSLPGRK
jgi:ribonuclease D